MFHFQIENYLLRNHETRKYLQEQAYRLQQGIVTSTTQQVRAAGSVLSQGLQSTAPGGTGLGKSQQMDREESVFEA